MSEQHQLDLEYVLAQYEWEGSPQVMPGPSGMNNITTIIQDRASKAVIRMYNNHADIHKLQFEHEMLNKLNSVELPIATPMPILNRAGATITTAPSGRLAAAFHYIEGERPLQSNQQEIVSLAEAAAHLTNALASIEVKAGAAYAPYYELESNYPVLDNIALTTLLRDKQLDDLKEQLILIHEERAALEAMKGQLRLLPHQWIHGDINCSNSLARDGKVVALLDFEFVTRDLRAMELAVLLTEFIQPTTEKLDMTIEGMLRAYTAIVPLTDREIDVLDSLIKLRSVDVTMHFIERYKQGLDSASVLRGIINHAAFVINGIKQVRIMSY